MKKRILVFILLAALIVNVPMTVWAANTVFMVPEISATWEPPGTIYKSPNLDALAYKSPPGPVAIYDGYDRNFMDVESLTLADGEVNGTYVVVTTPLPTELVIATEDIQPLREQLAKKNTKPQEDTQASTDDPKEASDEGKMVEWSFKDDVMPENFTSKAKVEVLSDKDIKVEFAYSGKLPEGTTVTIHLPKEEDIYKEGATLYFYYYNPKNAEYEYVSESIVRNSEVTFIIKHCSEYLITSEKLVEVDVIEKEENARLFIAIGIVVLVGISVVIVVVVNKKRKS